MTFKRKSLFVVGLFLVAILCLCVQQISVAPYQKFINVSENVSFKYWGNDFTVKYISNNPQKIIIEMNGKIVKVITKNITDVPKGVYWSYGDFHFEVKPVVFKIEDGKYIPHFEESWNTSTIFFKVVAVKKG